MPCYIHRKYWFGVKGDLTKALVNINAPTTSEGNRLTASDFEKVSAEEYENTILDYRYEDDEWQQ